MRTESAKRSPAETGFAGASAATDSRCGALSPSCALTGAATMTSSAIAMRPAYLITAG